jgi:ABC-type transporter Mla subunit MlaD
MAVRQFVLVNPGYGVVERPERGIVDRSHIAELTGRTVGLFSNNKPNVAPFLDELERLLSERLDVARTVRAGKLSSALPASPDELKRAEGVEYLIAATGD